MDMTATTERLPTPGETVLGSGFSVSPGGKGANQAIAAARAGGAVTMIGAVGSDDFAGSLTATLRTARVETGLIRTVPGASGIAVITVDDTGENSIIVIPGANTAMSTLGDDEVAAIRRSTVLVSQLEIPVDSVISGMTAAAGRGVTTILNPSPVRELPDALTRATAVLVVNEGEAAALGDGTLREIRHVVTTLGAAGARYRGPDGAEIHVPAPRVDTVDTTGAGDAFTGALAVGWAEGVPPREMLHRACAAGALATTVSGAALSSPGRAAIDRLVSVTYR